MVKKKEKKSDKNSIHTRLSLYNLRLVLIGRLWDAAAACQGGCCGPLRSHFGLTAARLLIHISSYHVAAKTLFLLVNKDLLLVVRVARVGPRVEPGFDLLRRKGADASPEGKTQDRHQDSPEAAT